MLKEIFVKIGASFSSAKQGKLKEVWCTNRLTEILERYFDFEEKPKKLWIQFHNRPGKERVEGYVITTDGDSMKFPIKFPEIVVEDAEIISEEPLDKFIKDLVGKTVYMEVWHE